MLGDANFIPVERRLLHHGAKFDFEQVVFPDVHGTPIAREVVRHPGSVVVLPLLRDKEGLRIVLIRNWRVSVETRLIELPAGTRGPGEDPRECADRELIEETGYRAATLDPLCRFYPAPGLCDELMHGFVADGLSHVGNHPEDDERLEVFPASPREARSMIEDGRIRDAKSIVMLMVGASRGFFGDEFRV